MNPWVSTKHISLGLGLLSASALLIALISQYGFGYNPCHLCIIQRVWHGAVIVAALFTLIISRPRLFLGIQTAALVICCAVSIFHFGVEQSWWEATRSCLSVTEGNASIESLKQQILNAPVARCDQPQWFFLGFSMAFYDMVLTFLMSLAGCIRLAKNEI